MSSTPPEFETTAEGYESLIDWVGTHTDPGARAWSIEGAGSYGAGATQWLPAGQAVVAAALDARSGARDFYESLSKSAKKQVLGAVYLAKRPATRAARVETLADDCAAGMAPRP